MNYTLTRWNRKKVILGKSKIDPAQPVHLLIGFHGADSTPENMLVHGNKLEIKNVVTAFAEGPVNAGNNVWSWWRDGPKQKDTVTAFLDYTAHMVDDAHRYVKTTFGPFRTSLWGFSQGGAAALVYALLGPHSLHKVASVCGFLPELPDAPTKDRNPAAILGIFGSNDEMVPPFLAEHALDEMKNRGHQVTVKQTPQGHQINAENLKHLSEFFNS